MTKQYFSAFRIGSTLHLSAFQLVQSSNGNDIETKRNDASIIGVFSVPQRNEPSYSKTWTDRSEANTIINILCRFEEITNIISPEFAGSKKNEYNQSKALQHRSKTNGLIKNLCKIEKKHTGLVRNFAGSKRKRCGLVQLQIQWKQSEPSQSKTSRDGSKTNNRSKLHRI